MVGRHFDPMRVLAAPRSVSALAGSDPRVLADDVWAKLLWAGLHLHRGPRELRSWWRVRPRRINASDRAREGGHHHLAIRWAPQRRAGAVAHGLHPLAAAHVPRRPLLELLEHWLVLQS